jgi:hypothetical protein
VKFLIDMPLSPVLAHWLAARGHDAADGFAFGLDRSSDAENPTAELEGTDRRISRSSGRPASFISALGWSSPT